jgi:hypothetical protein
MSDMGMMMDPSLPQRSDGNGLDPIRPDGRASACAGYGIGEYVIVRTYSAGVHCGLLAARSGTEVVLSGARRIWRWEGAFTLSEISLSGLASSSRLSATVPSILVTEAIEIIPCSAEASRILREHPAEVI